MAVAALKEVFKGCYTEKAKNESLVNVHLKCVLDFFFFIFILFLKHQETHKDKLQVLYVSDVKTNMCYINGKSEM